MSNWLSPPADEMRGCHKVVSVARETKVGVVIALNRALSCLFEGEWGIWCLSLSYPWASTNRSLPHPLQLAMNTNLPSTLAQ